MDSLVSYYDFLLEVVQRMVEVGLGREGKKCLKKEGRFNGI